MDFTSPLQNLLLPLFLCSNVSIILKNVFIYFRSSWHHWTQSPMVAHFDIFGPLFLAWNWSHFCHVQAETWLWFWSFIWRSESRACYVALPLKHNSFIQSIIHSCICGLIPRRYFSRGVILKAKVSLVQESYSQSLSPFWLLA